MKFYKKAILFSALLMLIGTSAAHAADAPVSADVVGGTVREYGQAQTQEATEHNVTAKISYPTTGLPSVDREILHWVESVYNDAIAGCDGRRNTNADTTGELTIDYNSYTVGDKYAGIEEIGFISFSDMAHPTDFFKTWTVDLEEGRILLVREFLDPAGKDTVLALVKEKLQQAYPDQAASIESGDASWLNHILLTEDGIDVLLPRGTALPSYLGSQRIHLSRDELGDVYLLPEH
jgi:hypothetical protein